MKFMKLGSKQDIFTVRGSSTSVASELPSDITFDVDGHKFHLHKFPLLAKWGSLNELMAVAQEAQSEEVHIHGFPGGVACFEMCAKYCYGITITLSPHNVGEVRCGAEFLHMTEATEKSNLIYKLEVFLASSILRGWKDALLCLRSSHAHIPWSEDLKIMSRCVESISSKACADTNEVDWSFSYPRPHTSPLLHDDYGSERSSPVSWSGRRMSPVPKDWWVEDVSNLNIDLYKRVILAVKAKGGAPDVVVESIRMYTLKHLGDGDASQKPMRTSPGNVYNELGRNLVPETTTTNNKDTSLYKLMEDNKRVLETLVSLLPVEKGASSCSVLLGMLKTATLLNAPASTKLELARRVGLQLEDASLHELMIPSVSYATDTVCDVDLMIHIVGQYMAQFRVNQATMARSLSSSHQRTTHAYSSVNFDSDGVDQCMTTTTVVMHSSQRKVAKVVDRYLTEIARAAKMPLSKFIQLATSVPDFARPSHDGLYRAIDMYLKEHPLLTKSERKRICSLMDCKKLSMEACIHAAQNDRLPLRVMVQVLFFDQVRAAVNGGLLLRDLQGSTHQQCEYGDEISLVPEAHNGNPTTWEAVHQDFTALKCDLASMKMRIAEAEREHNSSTIMQQQQQQHDDAMSNNPVKAKGMLSALKPEKLLSKLFVANRGLSSPKSS